MAACDLESSSKQVVSFPWALQAENLNVKNDLEAVCKSGNGKIEEWQADPCYKGSTWLMQCSLTDIILFREKIIK